MNNERITASLATLNNDRLIQNLIAQANARYILLNTRENSRNFPPYTFEDGQLNILALQYLNLGCSYAENDLITESISPLEKGASILETIHGSQDNKKETSNYYGLIAALAYYVSFQYSKSYILIKKVESTTSIARILSLFLLREFAGLNEVIYGIIFNDDHTDERITERADELGTTPIYEVVIAKAMDGFVKYLLTGNRDILEAASLQLNDLKEVATLENDPGIWWVIRLLLLISEGFKEASIWSVLGKYFDLGDSQVSSYIRALVYMRPSGNYELFITQRNSLDKVLNDEGNGCVVSIPTSSGKTRIAEIAILHAIKKHPDCKVLYIAPFRSLAFEIENSMAKVFENAGIAVSHLYGGSTYSRLDELAIEEGGVVIATPEKAKAILRANNEFMDQVMLVIIDEGHLLGDNKRLIVNEIFYEELRHYIDKNSGRFLVLSAVLPNAEDLALWLTASEEMVYRENWRPSDERLGILEWNNGSVNLKWESLDTERPSFNNRFIVREELPWKKWQRKAKYHPADLNEAVAATANRLLPFGPVLIYVGLKSSVFVMARAYLKALGDNPRNHRWKQRSDWRAFELACIEAYGDDDSEWLAFARKGILCHNASLHEAVRLPLERLMRTDKPLVIISTSTLGQGVNLGVSTVIFSTLYQSGELINARDFWNIAGRAGRAFVDHEGKILVARNTDGMRVRQRDADTRFVQTYFDKGKIDIAQSGILSMIKEFKKVAVQNDVNFNLLLTLIAENRVHEIGEDEHVIQDALDWIDDTLLSLLLEHNPVGAIDISWAEEFFSKSLAAIQAAREHSITGDEVAEFLHARVTGIVEKVGNDRNKWSSIVASGISLNSDLLLEERLPMLVEIAEAYLEEDATADKWIRLLIEIEKTVGDLPVLHENGNLFGSPDIDRIRELWINGAAISDISNLRGGADTINKLYTFTLPWVLNGIAKKMRNVGSEAEGALIEELAILVEVGLPSIVKVKIYQAGIRSRVAANELGDFFGEEDADRSIQSLRKELIGEAEFYMDIVSDTTKEWLEMMGHNADRGQLKVAKVNSFTFGKVHETTKTLIARMVNGQKYLMSPDLKFVYTGWGDIDFSSVSNVPGIEFSYNVRNAEWRMKNNNPYVLVQE